MWRIVRPDSVRVWKDPETVRRLSRYRKIIDNERIAKYLLAKTQSCEIEMTSSTDALWEKHREDSKRFVGFYSLKGSKSWSSPYKQTQFSEHDGNGLDFFLHHIMSDCMRKGLSELGSLDYTYDTVSKYL